MTRDRSTTTSPASPMVGRRGTRRRVRTSRLSGVASSGAGPRPGASPAVPEVGPARRRDVARERGGSYDPSSDAPAPHEVALDRLGAGVGATADIDLAPLTDAQLDDALAGLQRQVDRLTALRDRWVGTRHRRAASSAAPGQEQRALRTSQQEVRQALNLSPGEERRTTDAGRRLLDRPDLAAAVDDGRLRPEQATVIHRTLGEAPLEVQEELRSRLLDAASAQDTIELGATARRELARLDEDAAERAHERRRARRTASVARGPDGMLDVHARLSGLDAESVATAIHAFRTQDVPDSLPRTPGQRTADAIVAVARASLELGDAPLDRRVKPQVLVTIPVEQVAAAAERAAAERATAERADAPDVVLGARAGAPEGRWTGPLPIGEVERLVANATIRVLGVDVRGLPVALSRATDDVTANQYLALSHRDGGCRWPGCDAPPSWCDVAHARARHKGGRISLDNAVLLCRQHHRQVDLGRWDIAVDGAQATFTHPNGRTVVARQAAARPPDRRELPDVPDG